MFWTVPAGALARGDVQPPDARSVGASKSTTIGPLDPAGAWWMWAAVEGAMSATRRA